MESSDGRFVISFNGEIYNHAELRTQLEAHDESKGIGRVWRGRSDTETLLESIATTGLRQTLDKCVGMFAFALWDKHERQLTLVRDRFGEKPLYFGWVGGDFVFSSELKGLRSHPRFCNEVDRNALRMLAERTYIPAPHSIFQEIYKLEPGCFLTTSIDGCRASLKAPPAIDGEPGGLRVQRYWDYRDVVLRGAAHPLQSEEDALEQLESILSKAIEGQSFADVPVGAFLSGGIDSSTVVSLYNKYCSSTISTFTIGLEDISLNEAEYAKQVALHLGTRHNECYISVKEAQAVIPLLPNMYDEPFADSSQIPTYLVSRFAREQVTVALTGDGGDELFGGYNRHLAAPKIWSRLRPIPKPLRALIGNSLLPFCPQRRRFAGKVRKGLHILAGTETIEDVYSGFFNEWFGETSPVMTEPTDLTEATYTILPENFPSGVARLMYFDAVSYLPDDILCKVDRAAMAVSLETRVPFLDHRVAELAARIPTRMKIQGNVGKHILRRLLFREAPRDLFERPKSGFAIPVGKWIRGPLRDWAESLLNPADLKLQGYFDADAVLRRWHSHLREERDFTQSLWTVLMFQAWSNYKGVY